MTPSFANRGRSGGIENLRMLDAPARLANFSLFRRNGFECLFVKIEDHSIGAIADGVRLDLNAATQALPRTSARNSSGFCVR